MRFWLAARELERPLGSQCPRWVH